MNASNVVPLARPRSLTARSALVYLAKFAESHPERVIEVDSITHLGTLLGWERSRTSKQLTAWEKSGKVVVDRSVPEKIIIRILPSRDELERAGGPSQGTRIRRAAGARTKRAGKPANVADYGTQPNPMGTQNMLAKASENARDIAPRPEDVIWHPASSRPREEGDVHSGQHASPTVVAANLTALILAGIAAWFSVRGMIVLFPGDPISAVVMGIGLETGKIVSVVVLSAWGKRLSWFLRIVLVVLAAGCEILNASGVFGQLVIAHLHRSAIVEANFERSAAEADGKIELAQGKVADLDRRIATIDGMVDGAAARGKSRQATNAMRDHQKERAQLVSDREQARRELTTLKTSRSTGSAQHKVDEAESAPVVWAARMVGIDRDPEVITRGIIALIVICLDPLAIFLMAAVHTMSRRRRAA